MTTTATAQPLLAPDDRPEALALRDLAPVALGVVPFGLTLGVTMSAGGFHPVAALVGTPLIYAGSAQLTAVTTTLQGGGVVAAVLAGALVNARLVLYSAALGPRLRSQPRWFRWLAPQFLIDQTYLLAEARPSLAGAAFRRYWFALGTALLVVWSGAVAAGMVAGPALPPLPHLALVAVALFCGLLVPRLTDRGAVRVAVTAGAGAGAVALWHPPLAVVAGTLAGLAAARPTRRGGAR